MMVREGEPPGSSGRTWSGPAASSSTITARRSASMVRHRVVSSFSPTGIVSAGVPNIRRSVASAASGLSGSWAWE